jgi:3-phosphoshikimate 1-carboxyvinyltransferase
MSSSTSRLDWTVQPGGKPAGVVRVPGDKSISHRSVMLGSLAEGTTEVSGFLDGEDCLCTMKAFQAMGVRIDRVSDTRLLVHGVGLHGLRAPDQSLDLGNSGTSMRLMSGLLAAQKFPTTLIGDASLSRRPMKRVIEPLTRMGAHIESSEGKAPLHIRPVRGLHGIAHESKVASAQVKSCILLAGLYAEGETSVSEPEASRDHTERMLQAFGVDLDVAHGRARIRGGQKLAGTSIPVPADISSAAFFLLAAAIVPGAELLLRDVGINPTRTGVIDILRAMGAHIDLLDPRTFGGEPVSDIRVRGQGLHGIEVDPALVASAIDEFPAIFIAAACAEGETLITGAEELRVKESDRIQTMVDGLTTLGIEAMATPDGARIRGGQLQGGEIDSHGDHRVAMSFAMAALRAKAPIRILDCANVNTSFPGFARLAAATGLGLRA